jgi:inhibitor of KinA
MPIESVSLNESVMLQFQPAGDLAVQAQFSDVVDGESYERIRSFCRRLAGDTPRGVVEWVPAYTNVTIYYEPWRIGYDALCQQLDRLGEEVTAASTPPARLVEIPTVYGGEFGPDLEMLAAYHHLSTDDVIAMHTEPEYLVHMIGFVPGFPYLGGLNEGLHTPRLSTPRASVPAGSVGIAGKQTGIYPLATPGGWRIIGRTTLTLYDPLRDPPVLLHAGDKARFVPITEAEFGNFSVFCG